MTAIATAIFLISAAALGLELVLVRVFSIGHWHHLAFLVISTALLGFGAGGTFVTLCSGLLRRNYAKVLWVSALGLALAVPAVFLLCQKVPLDELQLIWDWRQVFYLFAYYLLFFVPFFFAGLFVALAFTVFAEKAHRLYFYNMTGSGVGVAAIVALMYGNSPQNLLLVISLVAFLSALIIAFTLSRLQIIATLACAAISLFAFGPAGPFALEINISENKSLVYYQALPDVQSLVVRYSPLGRLDCVQAPSIRYFPGLSLAYEGSLPRQVLIITDADGISAVNQFGSLSELDCFDHMTSALGYHLLSGPDTCIIGAGGGSDVAQALAGGANKVTAVEMNSQVVDLVRNGLGEFSSGIYSRPDVDVVVTEGRSFLQTTGRVFDIINISLLDSLTASSAGLYALNESHLYTVEAIEKAISRLRPNGLLSITRMLKTPPRDAIKMFATIAEALRRRGVTDIGKHMIIIRSWSTATIVVSPRPFSELQIENARSFAKRRSFDLVHMPGMQPMEANQYHVLEEPVYYQSARRILSDDYRNFYRDYAYNIRPATDDRPYFFNFFKWESLPVMIRTLGRQWLLFAEWGYLVLAATLLQAACATALLILLPLWVARPLKAVRTGKFPVLVYFLLLGLAYMFLEMGFIQKMTLLIGHPVFGVAVILLGFLVFSGLGSLFAGLCSRNSTIRTIWMAVLAILVLGLLEIVAMTFSFDWLVGFSRPVRILLGLLIVAPPAFFMGMPFPSALKHLNTRNQPLVPWAWGVNGFASVTGAVLGTFLAISVGFTTLVFVALACYLLAAVAAKQICT